MGRAAERGGMRAVGTSLWVVAACAQGGSQPETTGPTVTLAVRYEPATAEPPEGPAA